MNYKLIWFRDATEELQEIYDFYFDKNPNTADKIYNSILNGIDRYLLTVPQIGAREPMLENEKEAFRYLIVYRGLFKVIYFIHEDTVVITNVWCCRRDPQNIK